MQRVKRKMGIASSTATATASNGMRATAKVVIIKFVFLLPLPHLIFCLCDPMEWTKWTKNRQRWNEYYYGTNEMARKTEKLSSGLIFPSRSFKSMSYICNAYIYRYIVYFVIRFELLQSLSVYLTMSMVRYVHARWKYFFCFWHGQCSVSNYHTCFHVALFVS